MVAPGRATRRKVRCPLSTTLMEDLSLFGCLARTLRDMSGGSAALEGKRA